MKTCTKCKIEKEEFEFNKNQYWCKICCKEYYQFNKEKINEQQRQYYRNNKKRKKQYYSDNKEEINKQRRAYYHDNKEKIDQINKPKKALYYTLNKEEIRSKQKQHYALNKNKIKIQQKQYYSSNKEKKKQYYNNNKEEISTYHKEYNIQYYENNIELVLLRNAIRRANKTKQEININIDDIKINKLCPYLNIPMFIRGKHINSMTIDRIDNSKGYIKGNIAVVSYKANSIKNDLSLNEIILLNNNYYNIPTKNEQVCYDINKNLCSAKIRAKKKNIEFNISKKDIIVTNYCPLLNIKLEQSNKLTNNTPTLDRVDNTKGYVPGNVRIISHKANKSKSNSTKEEYNLLTQNLIKIMATVI